MAVHCVPRYGQGSQVTCIVGLVHDGKVTIGGDSAGVAGLKLSSHPHIKVFRNGSYVIGYTTSFRMGSILHYSFDPPEPEKDLDRMMNTSFIDAMRKSFDAAGYLENKSGVESAGTFMVGINGRLFTVQDDLAVLPEPEYAAVGCGAEIALGAMYASRGSAKKRITTALGAAEQFSGGVRGPYTLVTTK